MSFFLLMSNSFLLRRTYRQARRDLPRHLQHQHSQAVAGWLAHLPQFRSARRIAAYLAIDGELDPAPSVALAGRWGKQLFFPKLRPRPWRKLWFLPSVDANRVKKNRFGILEAPLGFKAALPPWALDMILVPLVAFDDQCHRLGMGGGYYDRTLAYLRHRHHWTKPLLVGVAHEVQKVPHLASRPWDVRLDIVVTEAGIYRSPSRRTSS